MKSSEKKLHFATRCLDCVESLVDHPASMTHAALAIETRERLGINDSLLRLSVGVEAAKDLIDDLEQALAF